MIPQHGRQNLAFGMVVSKTMTEVDVVLWWKGRKGCKYNTTKDPFFVWEFSKSARNSRTGETWICGEHWKQEKWWLREDGLHLGIMRTLSSIDRIFSNVHVVQAREFHGYHVFEKLGTGLFPSNHAAVRFVTHEVTIRESSCKRIPSWMSQHLIFWSFLNPFHVDDRL